MRAFGWAWRWQPVILRALGGKLSICVSLLQQIAPEYRIPFVSRKTFEADGTLKVLGEQFHIVDCRSSIRNFLLPGSDTAKLSRQQWGCKNLNSSGRECGWKWLVVGHRRESAGGLGQRLFPLIQSKA